MEWVIQTTIRILEGLGNTLSIYAVTLIFSIPLGIVLGIAKISCKNKILLKIINGYTTLFRGTPLLLQLYFIYYGLRGITFIAFGYELYPFRFLGPFSSAAIGFILNYTAYFTEIFRGGIQAVDKGQYEASKALGLSYAKSMYHVIIPQGMRAVLPSVANECITLVKDTALVSAIAMGDLLRNSREIVNRDGTVMPFIIVGLIYLLLATVVERVFVVLEKKQNAKFI